ncbi:MAG: hypothetical protein KME11_06770 [Timaviella obliquedivisa GSE-PSE-MK23-08B]|nr:hypothetical protein [Timaviella obliquedivisa GSE-PSE-MK23-08B]
MARSWRNCSTSNARGKKSEFWEITSRTFPAKARFLSPIPDKDLRVSAVKSCSIGSCSRNWAMRDRAVSRSRSVIEAAEVMEAIVALS